MEILCGCQGGGKGGEGQTGGVGLQILYIEGENNKFYYSTGDYILWSAIMEKSSEDNVCVCVHVCVCVCV